MIIMKFKVIIGMLIAFVLYALIEDFQYGLNGNLDILRYHIDTFGRAKDRVNGLVLEEHVYNFTKLASKLASNLINYKTPVNLFLK